jgi:glutamyl-tRNA reductase
MKARHDRPLLLIDLSVPRNIDPASGGLENVTLYNIDDLEALAREGVQARERELAACQQIIEAYVAALIGKLRIEEGRFERAGRSTASCYSCEIAKKVPYELATPPGLVVQTS